MSKRERIVIESLLKCLRGDWDGFAIKDMYTSNAVEQAEALLAEEES